MIDGGMIAELGGPVDIPHPGVPLAEAARLLGRDYRMMRRWLPVGAGRSNRERDQLASRGMSDGRLIWATFEKEGYPLKVRYEPPGRHGRNGREVPVVWSDGPLDPGAKYGKPPSRWWGTLWQSMAKGIPTEFEQVLVREPRWLPVKGQMRFRGWLWRCPGLCSAGADLAPSPSQGEGWDEGRGDERPRLSANVHDGYDAGPSPQPSPWEGEGAKASACGKLVRTLYAPLPVWTIGRYLGLNQGLGVEGLAGQWLPGVMDRWAGRRSLACLHCWRVRDQGFSSRKGWNELVAHLSGGLLFGHEVEQPSDFEYERRRAYVKRAQKRPQIDRAVIGGAAPIASMQAALSAPPPGDQQAAQAE
ncbi:MAG: hypothetical protein KTR15_07435 [Phycisphaeraceae bacterium]|nr:hypothetical protein [Phycisphaeraceae bacterium]